jgi:predicted nuclease with RNAse H fold
MNDVIRVIGVDCATEPQNVGISIGCYRNGKIELHESMLGNKCKSVAETIYSNIGNFSKVLIAIDAPLGWPENLGYCISKHLAGSALNIDSNLLFRRETDRFVKKITGKQSLDVGADRIARTAHAAMSILDQLRQLTGENINLAWNPTNLSGVSVIEVYPAVTMNRYGITNTGYKDKDKTQIRKNIIAKLCNLINIPDNTSILTSNADALDSAVCMLSAKDFIERNVYFPYDQDLAKKEGWIWVRNESM